ncbi:MAG: PilZ domain-containing protein [bacterium]
MTYERRKSDRRITDANFLVINCEAGKLLGRVLDLSCDGLLIGSEEKVEANITIPCHMTFPYWHGLHQFVTFEATSCWCKKNVLLDWYESGWSIAKMSEVDREILRELIADWKTKNGRSVFRIDETNPK